MLALLAAGFARAQSPDVIRFGRGPDTLFRVRNMAETRNGELLVNMAATSYVTFQNIGPWVMKASRPTLTLADTAFHTEPDFMAFDYLLEILPGPTADRYMLARALPDQEKAKTYFNIVTSDLDFTNRDSIVNKTFEDGLVLYEGNRLLLDGDNIVMAYRFNPTSSYESPTEIVFDRIDLEGNIVHQTRYPDSIFPFETFTFQIWNEAPRQYLVAGADGERFFHYYLVDSLFNLIETNCFDNRVHQATNNMYNSNIYFEGDGCNRLLPLDETCYLLASRYHYGWYATINGIQVTKRRRDNHRNLKSVFFYDEQNKPSPYGDIIGFEEGTDGFFYLAFVTNVEQSKRIQIVKLDSDLNVVWQRFCMEDYNYGGCFMKMLGDGGIAITGQETERDTLSQEPSRCFIVVMDEDWLEVGERDTPIRPYAFYPTPAQDRLRLNYSPDVKPAQIELYDLQGRLVRSQGSGLESFNLQGLAPGQYVMKVTMADGTTFTDKVVKE